MQAREHASGDGKNCKRSWVLSCKLSLHKGRDEEVGERFEREEEEEKNFSRAKELICSEIYSRANDSLRASCCERSLSLILLLSRNNSGCKFIVLQTSNNKQLAIVRGVIEEKSF
jgi:hypothetical protein